MSIFKDIILVGTGSFFGGIARYLISLAMKGLGSAFPWATMTAEHITSMLKKRLENSRVADWFSPRWTLFNECTILSVENGEVKERRPDRVMTDGQEWIVVDFKFGSPKPEYHDQVREYMNLIQKMESVSSDKTHGYLWYVYSNKIEEVK